MELWLDAGLIRSGYSWNFPAGDELRIGVGSFWPEHHVKEPTVRLTRKLGLEPDGYQGNWIPHKLRRAVEDGVFFTGDSAGHCLPLTAEGIRTAIYFGLACGREIRAVLDGRTEREQALATYGAFSDAHERKYRWMLNVQRSVGRMMPSRARDGAGEGDRKPGRHFVELRALPRHRSSVVRRARRRRYLAERQGEPPDALLDGRLGQVGVAEHEAVMDPPRLRVGVAQRVDPNRPGAGGSHERAAVDGPSEADDGVQARGEALQTSTGQVLGDRRGERVPARAVAAARLAQMPVVVAAVEHPRERHLIERRDSRGRSWLAARARRRRSATGSTIHPSRSAGASVLLTVPT